MLGSLVALMSFPRDSIVEEERAPHHGINVRLVEGVDHCGVEEAGTATRLNVIEI